MPQSYAARANTSSLDALAFTLVRRLRPGSPNPTASTLPSATSYLLPCQSISYSHPRSKYTQRIYFKRGMVEMPGFEPGSCQYFPSGFTLLFLYC
jgi:hypothetical protein